VDGLFKLGFRFSHFLKGYRRFLQFCNCRIVRSIPHSSVFKVQTARINYGKMERVVKNEMNKKWKKNEKGWEKTDLAKFRWREIFPSPTCYII
jgi:hypothetical protein